MEGQAHITAEGGMVGTRLYMAPEQYNGWADPRTDVYSLGVTLYELLTHTAAFEAATPEAVVRRVINAEVAPPRRLNPAIPLDLETIVLKAIAAEPTHRYQTAEALTDDLRRFVSGQPITARRLTTTEKVWRWARRNKLAASLLIALGAVMFATTVASVLVAVQFDDMRKESERKREIIEDQFAAQQRAERKSKEDLSRYLLRTAQAELATKRAGGRPQALAALREAAALSRELDLPPENRAALRREYIAALATIDIARRPDRTWELPGGEELPLGYSADGTRYAVAERPGEVLIRNTATNQEVLRIGEPGGLIRNLRFSRGGRYLAGVQNGKLKVWTLEDGKRIQAYGRVLRETFDFHPAESAIAFVDATLKIQLCQLRGSERQVVGKLSFYPERLRFDPAGNRLAACVFTEPVVHVIAVSDGTETVFPVPKGAWCVAWSPDGNRFAAGGADGVIYLYRSSAPDDPPLVLSGHQGAVVNVAFHPHDEILVSGSWDQTVRVWDLTHPIAAVRTMFSASYQVLEFSADGRSLGLGRDGTRAWVWEVLLPAVGQTVVRGENLWGSGASPDGRWLAGMGRSGLFVWDLRAGVRPVPVPHDFGLGLGRRVWFTPDSRSMIVGTWKGVMQYGIEVDANGQPRFVPSEPWEEPKGVEHWWSDDRTLL
ncbi:MAG: hypothetical protein L0241_30690, partial [Planctomycetia bacterium]|nr:hypothetical protein [Planctomycetia bacterium]